MDKERATMNDGDLISRETLKEDLENVHGVGGMYLYDPDEVKRIVDNAPAVDAVDAEEYNELREAFVDFVCSGIHNPAPYCKNKCEGCIDNRGWCITERCIGFNPDGERRNNV